MEDRNKSILQQIPLLVDLCERGILSCYLAKSARRSVIIEFEGRQIGRYMLEGDDERNAKAVLVVFRDL
jgi:hypothetical protein